MQTNVKQLKFNNMETSNSKLFFSPFRWSLRMKRGVLLKWIGIAALGTMLIEMLLIMTGNMPYSLAGKISFSASMFAFLVTIP